MCIAQNIINTYIITHLSDQYLLVYIHAQLKVKHYRDSNHHGGGGGGHYNYPWATECNYKSNLGVRLMMSMAMLMHRSHILVIKWGYTGHKEIQYVTKHTD